MPQVNWLAIILAAIVMFGLGALWYSPWLFVKQWARAAGVNRDGSPGPGSSLARACGSCWCSPCC